MSVFYSMNQAAALVYLGMKFIPWIDSERKVRAPQGMMPGNTRARGLRNQVAGQIVQQKANRLFLAKPKKVRVKGWGKSPPRYWQQYR